MSPTQNVNWRNNLAQTILKKIDLPEWKSQEQIDSINITIINLVNLGITQSEDLIKKIVNMSGNIEEESMT